MHGRDITDCEAFGNLPQLRLSRPGAFCGNGKGSRAREQPPAGGDRFLMLESERDLVLRKSSGGA